MLEGKTGNIFNTYEWGGYLIWKLPKMKVFVDGRMPAWKDDFGRYPYAVFLAILQTQPGWNEELRRNKTDYILISPGTFLDLLLQKESKTYGWQEIYRDKIAVLYQNVLKQPKKLFITRSANGRPIDSGSMYLGSNPSLVARLDTKRPEALKKPDSAY